MTPKEKAKDLFNKINMHIPIDASFDDSAKTASWKIEKDHLITKKITLIAVDEILQSHYQALTGVNPSTYNYWQEVKQEIKKL